MPKHALSFIELHNPFFMQGTNLGNKINAAQKGAKILLDDERSVVWVYFKGKVAFIPTASVASGDAIDIPDDVKTLLGIQPVETAPMGPPAVARSRRTQAEMAEYRAQAVPMPDHDPNDMDAAAKHRALVRAASANSNRPNGNSAQQNDLLIQESRAAAMGVKLNKSSQVQNAQQVGELAGITGKKKAISHQELKVQVAQEMKE